MASDFCIDFLYDIFLSAGFAFKLVDVILEYLGLLGCLFNFFFLVRDLTLELSNRTVAFRRGDSFSWDFELLNTYSCRATQQTSQGNNWT